MQDFNQPTSVPNFDAPIAEPSSLLVTPSEGEARRAARMEQAEQRRELVSKHATTERINEVLDAVFALATGRVTVSKEDGQTEEIRVKPDAKAQKLYLDTAGINQQVADEKPQIAMTEEDFATLDRIARKYGKTLDPSQVRKIAPSTEGP